MFIHCTSSQTDCRVMPLGWNTNKWVWKLSSNWKAGNRNIGLQGVLYSRELFLKGFVAITSKLFPGIVSGDSSCVINWFVFVTSDLLKVRKMSMMTSWNAFRSYIVPGKQTLHKQPNLLNKKKKKKNTTVDLLYIHHFVLGHARFWLI